MSVTKACTQSAQPSAGKFSAVQARSSIHVPKPFKTSAVIKEAPMMVVARTRSQTMSPDARQMDAYHGDCHNPIIPTKIVCKACSDPDPENG